MGWAVLWCHDRMQRISHESHKLDDDDHEKCEISCEWIKRHLLMSWQAADGFFCIFFFFRLLLFPLANIFAIVRDLKVNFCFDRRKQENGFEVKSSNSSWSNICHHTHSPYMEWVNVCRNICGFILFVDCLKIDFNVLIKSFTKPKFGKALKWITESRSKIKEL
jgi:hypothetical protein